MLERRSPLAEYDFIVLGLAPARAELIKRIEQRVEQMFSAGFVDEVRGLLADFGPEIAAFKAIGYREISRYLNGDISLDEARRLTTRSTVQYAKRQMTWFRGEEGVKWFSGWGDDPELYDDARQYLQAELKRFSTIGDENVHFKNASSSAKRNEKPHTSRFDGIGMSAEGGRSQ
jgi:tRNA dimethylallyltransferase